MTESTSLPDRLRHVYWIGGGSGAGKSVIARRLARDHGLRLYDTDAAMSDHADRSTPEGAPYLSRFKAMGMDERWLDRTPERMLETFHWFRGEGFDLIVDDLLELQTDTGVVAEGFRLLPHCVQPLLAEPNRAIWLLPTPTFRWAALEHRGTTWDIPRTTTDPERALRNLLERDRMFTERLAEETNRLGLPTIEVDVGLGEDQLVEQVREALGL